MIYREKNKRVREEGRKLGGVGLQANQKDELGGGKKNKKVNSESIVVTKVQLTKEDRGRRGMQSRGQR